LISALVSALILALISSCLVSKMGFTNRRT